jgi:hypothetical protein
VQEGRKKKEEGRKKKEEGRRKKEGEGGKEERRKGGKEEGEAGWIKREPYFRPCLWLSSILVTPAPRVKF